MVKNPLSNVGHTGSIPGQETKIPHVSGQLSPCITTREKPTHAAIRESPCSREDPVQQKLYK